MDIERARTIRDEADASTERLADLKPGRYDMDEHIAAMPDVVTQPAAYNRWLARQPDTEPVEIVPPEPMPPTVDEVRKLIGEALKAHAENWQKFVKGEIAGALAKHTEIRNDAIGTLVGHDRRRFTGEIEKLRNDFELRLAALLGKIEKLERAGGADVIDLPNPLRSPRRA